MQHVPPPDHTVLCSDQASVKRKTGRFMSTVKEKPRQLELILVAGSRTVALKVFRLGKKDGGGDESFILNVGADSVLRCGLPNESALSLSVTPSGLSGGSKDEVPVLTFASEETFNLWKATLETCIACLKANRTISDELYLQTLDLTEGSVAASPIAKLSSLAYIKQSPASNGGASPQKPPKPEKPPRVRKSPTKPEATADLLSTDIQSQPSAAPAALPVRPAVSVAGSGAMTPARHTSDAFSTKPLASAGRPWLAGAGSGSTLRPTLQDVSITANAANAIATAASVGTPQRHGLSQGESSEVDQNRISSFASAAVDSTTPWGGESNRNPVQQPSPFSVQKADPPTPPTRWADRVLDSYASSSAAQSLSRNLDSSGALGVGGTAQRRAQVQPMQGHQISSTALGHSEFIYDREVQALTQMNEQLSTSLDQVEEQRVADQDGYLRQITELQERLEASNAMIEILAAEKTEVRTELDRTNDALHSMALWKDQHEADAAEHLVKVAELEAQLREIETRAEAGEESLVLVSLREALKNSKDRASELDKNLGAKTAELAASRTALDRAQGDVRTSKEQLVEKVEAATKLRETSEALLLQLSALKEELVSVKAAREEESARALRDLERARVAVETERAEKLNELEECRVAERKSKKTITMYEVLTTDQQAKINALTEALESFAETKRELSVYTSNAESLAKSTQLAQDVCARLEKELSSAYQQVASLEAERSTAVTETRSCEAKLVEGAEMLALLKRQNAATVAQLVSDKEVLQLRVDTVQTKCANLESELIHLQSARVDEAKVNLKQQQALQDAAEAAARTHREEMSASQLALQSLQTTEDKLRRELERNEEMLQDKVLRLADAATKLGQLEGDAQSLRSAETEQRRALQAAERKLAKAKELAEEREQAHSAAVSALEKRLDLTTSEFEASNRKRDEAAAALRLAENEKKTLERELLEAQRDVQELTRRLSDLTENFQTTSQDLNARSTELDVLRRQHDSLQAAKSSLDAALKERGGEITELTVALSAAKAREDTIASLLDQIKALDSSLAVSKTECQERDKAISDLQQSVHELQMSAASTPLEIASLKQQIASQRERLQQGADQLGVLKTSFCLIQRERDELSGLCSESKAAISELKGANSMLQLQIDTLRREVAAQKGASERSEAALSALENERNGLLDALRASEGKCADLRDAQAKLQERYEAGERRLRLLEADLADRQRGIESLDREKESLAQALQVAQGRMRGMITEQEATGRVERLNNLWSAEREAMTQRLQALATRQETDRAAGARGREELFVSLRGLVTSGGALSCGPGSGTASSTIAATLVASTSTSNPFSHLEAEVEVHDLDAESGGETSTGGSIESGTAAGSLSLAAPAAAAAAGVSHSELYADILRVGGACDTLRTAILELINHMTIQYTATALDPAERDRLRSHLDAITSAGAAGKAGATSSGSGSGSGLGFRSVEQLVAEVRSIFDHYRRREREAAAVLLQTSRDESEARRFAEDQAGECRRELKQTQAWLDALRSQKDAADRAATAEVSLAPTPPLPSIPSTAHHFIFLSPSPPDTLYASRSPR